MYKSLHNLAPSYMSNKFIYSHDIHNLALRSTTNQTLHIPKPRLEIYRKSLSYFGPKIWNTLPESGRNARSLGSFKQRYLRWQNGAPGRFAQKPVSRGTIGLGRFAQIFERDCSHKFTGTICTKLKLLGQFIFFKGFNKKKYEVQFLSVWMNSFICYCWILLISWEKKYMYIN